MKRWILPLTLLLLVPLTAQPAAGETARAGCGGQWRPDGAQCSFVFPGGNSVGLGVSVIGDPVGAAVARLEMVRSPMRGGMRGVREVLLECDAVGFHSWCGAGMTSSDPIAPRGTRMYCVVVGRGGTGTYGCSGG